jgi:DNA replication protein DnaC
MTGPVGTGKTFAAACIANALIERGVPVLMTSFPVILGTSKYELNDTIRQAQEYDLIIVDDLGVERDTDYALEIVFQFVDARYRSGKPLIVTTNLTPQEMRKQTGLAFSRIYDRIMEMWQDRFADASDFTFFFIGNIDEAQIRELSAKYLATLPTVKRKDKAVDTGMRFASPNSPISLLSAV